MHNRLLALGRRVKVLDTLYQLLNETFGDVNLNGFVSFVTHVLVQTDPRDVLLNQVDVFGTLKMVVNFADVWVFELLHALDFTLDCLLFVEVVELILWVNFDCNSLLCNLVLS